MPRRSLLRTLGRAFAAASPRMRVYMFVSLLLMPAGAALIAVGYLGHHHTLLIVGLALWGAALLDTAIVSPVMRARRAGRGRTKR